MEEKLRWLLRELETRITDYEKLRRELRILERSYSTTPFSSADFYIRASTLREVVSMLRDVLGDVMPQPLKDRILAFVQELEQEAAQLSASSGNTNWKLLADERRSIARRLRSLLIQTIADERLLNKSPQE